VRRHRLATGTDRARHRRWRSGSLFGHALTSASPLIIEDIATRTGLRIPPLLIDHDVVAGMSVVIDALDGGAWGLLGVHMTARRRFTAEDVNFLQAVAHVLAAAIHREAVTEALAAERTTLEDRVAQRTRALANANKLLKRLSARLMETQEGERRRIARIARPDGAVADSAQDEPRSDPAFDRGPCDRSQGA
jgi:GAF domain-containing protein